VGNKGLSMILNDKNIKDIKEKKITYVKNFTSIEETYDFNKISYLVDSYSLYVDYVPKQINYFNSIWKFRDIDKLDNQFFVLLDFLSKIFKYPHHIENGVDIFFSFVTNTGRSHVDKEDVFLVGLYGKTIYKVIENNIDYCLERGDLLYIPKGIWHKPVSATPRSIASIGFFE
tara:strand:+ start:566 stop:1084 length:519 start_codon:yes stop_codon:yes gene_type:complete